MNYLDTLYRALVDYRKNTLENNDCKTQRDAIIVADNENDKIVITRQNCTIELDWVETIERGLEFVEKAIKEERQFIRSNGEVIPIEKVKRVSKDSVEHLARHSNYFTREQEEGNDLVPDQLYTVERLSDYAVYENRFLYMMLCYLRDFIGMRYEKIVELTNTYNGNMEMNKSIVESNRRIKFEIKLEEEKKNDDYLREHNQSQSQIDRILTIYKATILYLNTPLMIEVAKSPMIKPPIMRTNVLKMNRNFREALSLYEYVTAYDKDGYTIETETKQISPFVGVVADEFSEMVELALFLTYEHGLGLKEYLKKNYDQEEKRRIDEERRKLAEQIRNVARHLKTDGITAEEYILMLEKRIRDLEKMEEELAAAKKEIENYEKEVQNLNEEIRIAQDRIRALGAEIVALHEKYTEELRRMQTEYEEKIDTLILEHEQRIEEINRAYEETMEALKQSHLEEVDRLNAEHQEEVDVLNAVHQEKVEALNTAHQEKVDALNEKIAQMAEEKRQADEEYELAMDKARTEHSEHIRSLNEEYTAKTNVLNAKIAKGIEDLNTLNGKYTVLQDEKALISARYKALQLERGQKIDNEQFTSKEGFDELEREYELFRKFFKGAWRKTRKVIRLEQLGTFTEVLESIFAKKNKEGTDEELAKEQSEKKELENKETQEKKAETQSEEKKQEDKKDE